MSNYFILIYKGPITKWASVNLIITDFWRDRFVHIIGIVYINAAAAYFYFSAVYDKKKISTFLNCYASITL